jgi:hypothetical protein
MCSASAAPGTSSHLVGKQRLPAAASKRTQAARMPCHPSDVRERRHGIGENITPDQEITASKTGSKEQICASPCTKDALVSPHRRAPSRARVRTGPEMSIPTDLPGAAARVVAPQPHLSFRFNLGGWAAMRLS